MPKRLTGLRRYMTEEVQGEDSYVCLRPPLAGEVLVDLPDGADWQTHLNNPRNMLEVLAPCIQEWNWVDDLGEELPIPSKDPSVVSMLTMQEVLFLVGLFQGALPSKPSDAGRS